MNNTKSEIIRIALRMVSERGYEWLSFKKIADEIGIAKSSIYHYFKNKEDLGIAIMEIIEERVQKNKDEILTYESEKEKLDAYLIRADRDETLYAEAVAQLAFNFNGLPPKLQEKIREHSVKNYEFVLGILKRGAKKKEFSIKKDLEEAAMGIILMSIGGYLYARVFDDENIDISRYITDSIIN